jgi:hypothetical protein
MKQTVCFMGLVALQGCIGFRFQSERVGTARPVAEARGLEPGKTTLPEVLERLGPPDLILRAGDVDRAYYVAWDSDYFKLVLQVGIPVGSRNLSWDAFILAIGSEDFQLARLEFDRAGVLRSLQAGSFETSRSGEYFALDNRIVENFIEDRRRALELVESDDDDEDVELDVKPKKK